MRINSIKTEAAKGVKEYKPSKTIAVTEKLTSDAAANWENIYRDNLIERIKVFKAISAKSFFNDLYAELIHTYMDENNKLITVWNLEKLKEEPVFTLRDLAVLLENSKKK